MQKKITEGIQPGKEKRNPSFFFKLALLVLILYPLRHILYGVEWWDTGYNYGNYVYMYRMDPMWVSGTFLSTALGHLFTLLPWGNYMWGMNMYTSLMVSFLGAVFFCFFVKKVEIPIPLAFVGELLAENLCWCPTAVLYNYLTYCLWGMGCIFLYLALTGEKREALQVSKKTIPLYLLAGVCLGVNVLTRFPNLAQMGMIVTVWAMAIIQNRKLVFTLWQTIYCVLGYILGLAGGLCLVAVTIGIPQYIGGIKRLLAMPSEASDYSLYGMLYSQYMGYRYSLHWLKYLLIVPVLVTGLLLLFAGKKGKKTKPWEILVPFLMVVNFVAVMLFYWKENMFQTDYHTKESIFYFAAFFVVLTLVSSLVVIFGKGFSDREKLLSGMGVVILVITPLGSNNQLYQSINNLFMIAPFQMYMLWRFLKGKENRLKTLAFRYCLGTYMAFFLVQSTLFGATYVFQEAKGGKNLNTKIENNDILKGMKTSGERAEQIGSLSLYVKEQGLKGKEVLLYGHIPSLSYYLEMPFVFTPWPDLRSYNSRVFQKDLQELEERVRSNEAELPVLLMDREEAAYLWKQQEETENKRNDKLELLKGFYEKYRYSVDFENEKFVLMTAKDEE